MRKIPDELMPILQMQSEEYVEDGATFPKRPDDNQMDKYSKVDPALVISASVPSFNMSKSSIGRNLNIDHGDSPTRMCIGLISTF